MCILPLISIIVPVYNAEKYLVQCLESLLRQTYTNIEIICINDGSKDDSEKIIKSYVECDDRVRLIEQKNCGVSKSRNKGILCAKGKYLMFVDADDWIELDTCEKALKSIEIETADVVMWSYVSEHRDKKNYKKIFPQDMVFDKTMTRRFIHRRFVGILGEELTHPELADSLCPVWGKLYRSNIIKNHNIKFVDLSEIGTYEDGLFNLEVFSFVSKTVYLNDNLYHYRHDNDNSITSKYNKNLDEQWKRLFYRIEKYITEECLPDEYMQALNNRIVFSILGLGLNILTLTDISIFKKLKMLKIITQRERYREACKSIDLSFLPIHWKVFYFCAKHEITIVLYCMLYIIKRIII